jgi:hypothetical protein
MPNCMAALPYLRKNGERETRNQKSGNQEL